MQLIKPLIGIFAVLGTWPQWERYFDLSRKGLKISYAVLVLSFAPIWLIIYGVQFERARIFEQDVILPEVLSFILIVGVWLFSFPMLAYLIGMILDKMDRVRPWMITRNWTVFGLALLAGIAFGLTTLGLLPFMLANGVLFAAYLGLLAADIRLAQKVAGFNWGSAILIGCVIVAVGMTFVQLSISR